MLNVYFALQRVARLQRMRKGETGASAVEYGLLVALIAAVIVGAVIIFGDMLSNVFQGTCDEIDQGAATVGGLECQ